MSGWSRAIGAFAGKGHPDDAEDAPRVRTETWKAAHRGSAQDHLDSQDYLGALRVSPGA